MSYRVYFGRLPDTLSQDDFEKLLEQHGKAKNIEWKSGYAYVDYKHGSDASNTVQNLNGKELGGNNILVELAQNGAGGYSIAGGFSARLNKPLPRPVRTPHRVRIENLSSRAKWMELKELLSLAGEVTFADTHKRRQGEGIVEFANKRDLVESIKMFDRTSFFGRTIRLYDESPRNRSGSRNQKRSRSRSRSHRRSSPGSKDRKKRSRTRSKSPDRKVSHSERRSEAIKRVRSKSVSPRRKSQKSKSPSISPSRHTSRKQRSSSRTLQTKSSKYSHKKAKKPRQDLSRSRSKSPRRTKKHKVDKEAEKHKRKQSHSSSSDNEIDLKRKSKASNKKRPPSSSESKSDSGSSSNKGSESDDK